MLWGRTLIGLAAAAGLAFPLCCCKSQAAPAAGPSSEQHACCSKKEAPQQHGPDCPCKGQDFRDAFAKTEAPRTILDQAAAGKLLLSAPQWTSLQVWRPAAVPLTLASSDPDLPARGSPRYLLLEIFRC
jgi:hypothetical protein